MQPNLTWEDAPVADDLADPGGHSARFEATGRGADTGVLVWQWGRRGAGPRYAAELAGGFRRGPGVRVALSLSRHAELIQGADAPDCEVPIATYAGPVQAALRFLRAPLDVPPLARRLLALRLDWAICAMPAPLDLMMAAALRRAGVPIAVVVHDADIHPGDGVPLQMTLQRALVRRADAVVVLSEHVAERLRAQGLVAGKPLVLTSHPPFAYGPVPPPPRAHGGPLRLLSFGRLLPYKGLDLLADTLRVLGPRPDIEVRVVGSGPESPALAALRALPGVTVSNRWVPEAEVGALLAWSDVLVLSHKEASQSGVAAAAVAARRWVVATKVGGIAEQLRDEPLATLCAPDPVSLAHAITDLLLVSPPMIERTDNQSAWRDAAGILLDRLHAAVPARRRQA